MVTVQEAITMMDCHCKVAEFVRSMAFGFHHCFNLMSVSLQNKKDTQHTVSSRLSLIARPPNYWVYFILFWSGSFVTGESSFELLLLYCQLDAGWLACQCCCV